MMGVFFLWVENLRYFLRASDIFPFLQGPIYCEEFYSTTSDLLRSTSSPLYQICYAPDCMLLSALSIGRARGNLM